MHTYMQWSPSQNRRRRRRQISTKHSHVGNPTDRHNWLDRHSPRKYDFDGGNVPQEAQLISILLSRQYDFFIECHTTETQTVLSNKTTRNITFQVLKNIKMAWKSYQQNISDGVRLHEGPNWPLLKNYPTIMNADRNPRCSKKERGRGMEHLCIVLPFPLFLSHQRDKAHACVQSGRFRSKDDRPFSC